jgi:hypothetical protein
MLYSVALFIHVLGAIGFFVALGILYVCVVGVRHAPTVGTLRSWAIAGLRVIRLLFPLSGACILIAGIYMLIVAWGAQAGWALVALGAFVLIGIATGTLVIRRIGGLLREVGSGAPQEPLSAAILRRARDPVLWLAANAIMAALVGIVFLMTVKPDILGSLVALGIALLVGLAIGLVTLRQPAGAAVEMNGGAA